MQHNINVFCSEINIEHLQEYELLRVKVIVKKCWQIIIDEDDID